MFMNEGQEFCETTQQHLKLKDRLLYLNMEMQAMFKR